MTAQDIAAQVTALIIDLLAVDAAQATPEAEFAADLGADSLDMVDLTMEVEDRFDVEISDDEAAAVRTVGDAIALVERKL